MSVPQILRDIEERGLSITAADSNLRLQGPKERMDAELIGRIKAHKAELIAHLDASGGFALTELQKAYLVGRGELFEIGNVASHIYHEIEGSWDLDRLEAALNSVVARHGMLRTRFTSDGRQVEESAVDVRIERVDLRGQSPDARVARREAWSHRVLPADQAPLLAVAVLILDDRMVLQISTDGLVMDAISAYLFFQAWWWAYNGEDAGPEPEASFQAYVEALEAARDRAPARRSRAYWLERLADLAPHPDLPLCTDPAAITRPRFTQHTVRLAAPAWSALKARAAAEDVTPTTMLLAGYAETLARWGAGPRFTLNTTFANRPPIHPRIVEAIGNFSETMLVELDIDRSAGFADRARELQARLRRQLDNRHFSGIEVLRELARRGGTARMPYTFNSALGYLRSDVDGSALELFGPETYTCSQTPQVWLNAFAFEQHGGLVVQFDSVDGLFPENLVEALVGGYRTLLETLLDETAWSATTFDLLPADQRQRRRAANDTEVKLPDSGLLDAFLAHAERVPDSPAIITETGELTYRQLCDHALHAASWLRARGVGRDELVGLVMRRGPEQVIGILAAVLAGAAYLPVDAALPAERRNYLLTDGRVRCVLTNVDWSDDGRDTLALDARRPAEPVTSRVAAEAGSDDLAYVLYTSGTTGEPKGVMVSRRSVANVVADCNGRFGIGPGDRFFGISAFNFDLSAWDVFGALSAGAAIVLPDADKATDAAHWLRLCDMAGVTVWNSVPAIVALLNDQAEVDGAEALATLRLVMMSGDRIPPTLPATLRKLKPALEIISLGGPTETTIWNILHPVGVDEDGTRSIPYGRPNANNRAYVVDADGCDTPDWVPGEICAAGTGLARGYWNDDARTAERFLDDERRGERLYRTGDLGRYLPNGDIDILGRTDFQIKVNGYRIEAGEVETRLVGLEAVRQAVVVRQDGVAGARLLAHLVPTAEHRPSDSEVREALRQHLPDYMIPAAIEWHEALPLNRNGKVDRAALIASTPTERAAGGAAPDSELEKDVAEIWARVLKMPVVDVGTTIGELGGDSIAAARILAGVRKRFRVSITLDQLREVETVRAMAARIGSVT
ncbi:amino acid adenylation domain-containing protein [Actinophytocola sp.]|uniref:non-ribosomal peptide synthetase n=1 Tax=Actinophytocola sp. TaxID=1872138 RepID=UPI002ED36558